MTEGHAAGKEDNLASLFDLISGSRHCVAFTGAGVSTLSGIPDFRGPKGVYRDPGKARMFELSDFLKDPSRYYAEAKEFIYEMDSKKPSVVHLVLAELERKGKVKAVITQNIDMLHQKAGSSRVLELHGSPSVHSCVRCARSLSYEEVAPMAKRALSHVAQNAGAR
jgi:NAD-dependent deacetylase